MTEDIRRDRRHGSPIGFGVPFGDSPEHFIEEKEEEEEKEKDKKMCFGRKRWIMRSFSISHSIDIYDID